MKTFFTDKPFIRYTLLTLGVCIASFVGSIAGILLISILLKP